MRLIRYLLLIPIIVILLIIGGWYYVTYSVSSDLNARYAEKKFSVQSLDKSDYFIIFHNITPAGFPYKISWDINGWQEESRTSQITYISPIKFGYDLLKQKLFISYDGDIIASYKPTSRGFGSRLKINNYQINVDIPLSKKLLEEIKTISNPVQILNYFKEITISTDQVEIFDLSDNEKFYDKEFERIKISFTPNKIYENLNDLFNNMPKQYFVDYSVKTLPNDAKTRLLPVSLFYGFLAIPSDCDVKVKAAVTTQHSKIIDFMNDYEIKANIVGNSKYLESKNINFYYQTNKKENYNKLEVSSNLKIKTGFFDQLFATYPLYSESLLSTPFGRVMDGEFKYIIQNKELFKFSNMEEISYDIALKINSKRESNKTLLKIDDLSIFSENSGFKLIHSMESGLGYNNKHLIANGDLFIKNYPEVIEFTSGYIYRFGKFKILNAEARELYINVNKAFLKDISDHPQSISNDLSFNYKFDSNTLDENMFGSAKINNIPKLYSLMLYQKLFDKVGYGGDVLNRMRKILPQIDGNEPLLKKILPKISDKNIDQDKIEQTLNKVIPKEAQNIIKKLIPKNKN
ncbi:MAG: hypothetical protein EKK61_02500 [Rickettsiales bacterium]|nr:MAG: hypothetical protein EKK61_02500 [Rickettsiales bacterium]